MLFFRNRIMIKNNRCLQAMADGTVRIFDSAGKTLLGVLNIAKDGTISVLNVGGDVIKLYRIM